MFRKTRTLDGEHALAVPTAVKGDAKSSAWRTSLKAPAPGHTVFIIHESSTWCRKTFDRICYGNVPVKAARRPALRRVRF